MTELFKLFLHAPQFLITWSIFFSFGIAVYIAYILRNDTKFAIRNLVDSCVPFSLRTEKSFHADVKIYLISKATSGLITVPAMIMSAWCAVCLSQAIELALPNFQKLELSVFSASVCTVIVFITIELSDFICHYTEHKVPFLWELHKVHHSAQVLNPLTSLREHPGTRIFEAVVRGLMTAVPGGLFVFLFGFSAVEVAILPAIATKVFTLISLDPLKHSHHPISLGFFDKILISPHMHQIHHSKKQEHWDKNFGTNLSIFDWFAGTGYKPARGEEPIYGISGLKDETLKSYNTMRGAYWSPITKSAKKLKKMTQKFQPSQRFFARNQSSQT